MLSGLHKILQEATPVATIIISVAFMLLFGFAVTRLTKLLRLPNVTAYILTGILLGQESMPPKEQLAHEDEAAFTEAAEQYEAEPYMDPRQRRMARK